MEQVRKRNRVLCVDKGKQVLITVPDRTHLKPLSEICEVIYCVEKASERNRTKSS
jgi:hypothetical protein